VEEFGRSDLDEPTLAELIAYIDLKTGSGDDTIQVSKAELGLADTVKIMTIHAAKGLEWPVVFIAAANNRDFAINAKTPILPPELEHTVVGWPRLEEFKYKSHHQKALASRKRELTDRETRRIAYVAVTRAKVRLYITWSISTPPRTGKSELHPQFVAIAEHCDERQAPPAPVLAANATIGGFARNHLETINKIAVDLATGASPDPGRLAHLSSAWQESGGDPVAIAQMLDQVPVQIAQIQSQLAEIERIEQFAYNPVPSPSTPERLTLSHTRLKTFRTCPHRYYLRYVVGLPGFPDRPAATYGTKVHAALHADAVARMQGTAIDLASFWPTSTADKPADLPYIPGSREGYANSVDSHSTVLLSEEPFTLRLPTINLTGIIDRLQELPDGTVEVTDFKTDLEVRSLADVRADWQLAIYLLAMRERRPRFEPQPTQASMVFLRHGKRVIMPRDDAELDAMTVQIEETATAIRAITPTDHRASETTCRWCDFNRICQFSAHTPTD